MLCVDDTATGNDAAENEVTYKTCFERFLMQFLSGTIKWIGKKSEFNTKEKFLMLLDVKTRRPEDFQRALNKLELTGKTGGKRKGSQMTEENYTGRFLLCRFSAKRFFDYFFCEILENNI